MNRRRNIYDVMHLRTIFPPTFTDDTIMGRIISNDEKGLSGRSGRPVTMVEGHKLLLKVKQSEENIVEACIMLKEHVYAVMIVVVYVYVKQGQSCNT